LIFCSISSARVQAVSGRKLRPFALRTLAPRGNENPPAAPRTHSSARDGWQKIFCHRYALTHYVQGTALRRIDDLVAIGEITANQRKMVIVLPRARHDLRRTAIGIHDVIAFPRYPHFLTVIQCELQRRCRLLDHPAVTGLAALGCPPVNSDRGMSENVVLLLTNNRLSLFAELELAAP
jgi:hypothetical protein